ncbi:MAG: hypothetical protein V7K46_23290 [Nostoc sp.]
MPRSTIPTGLAKRARAVPVIDAATYHQECISDRQMSKPSMLLQLPFIGNLLPKIIGFGLFPVHVKN